MSSNSSNNSNNQASSELENDPFAGGLSAYATSLRSGALTITATVSHCLARIEKYDGKLQAFQAVDGPAALETARALDKLLASGTDLGPLMGVPIGVKDIMAATGFPTTNGSLYEAGIPGNTDGPVVATLRAAGCIVLGKTKTVEYALGATGLNGARGTPWNPWDLETKRTPGGSSSGSGVSVAAGFTGFSLGTDTGGSVRIPACFNGLFGHKTTVGRWSTAGVFPLSPTLDSIGPLCRTAADAAIVHKIVCGSSVAAFNTSHTENSTEEPHLKGVVLGIPQEEFLDGIEDSVMQCFEASVEKLKAAGATIVNCACPEALEKITLFPKIVPPELLGALTLEGFEKASANMDPVTRERATAGLTVTASEYFSAQQRLKELAKIGEEHLSGLDGWISPTCPFGPLSIDSLSDPEEHQRSMRSSQNTQTVNLMRMCASSMPIHQLSKNADEALPVGLQLMMAGEEDEKLLSLSMAIQNVLGVGRLPTLTGS